MGHRSTVAISLVFAVTTLSACTNGGDEPKPDDRALPAPTQGATPTPTPQPRPEPGPLDAYLGLAGVFESPEEIAAYVARRENVVATCMAEQGFDYTPVLPKVDEIEYIDGPTPGTREFVDQYGYGLWRPAPGGGAGYMWSRGSNPNFDRVETMSEAEGEAYELALWGPVTEVDADGSVGRDGGCSEQPDSPRGAGAAWLVGVQEEATAFLAALDQDTRFVEVDAAWASCMADAGFAERSPAAAEQRTRGDYQALVASDTWPENDVVAERADEELRLAVADMDCREATDWTAQHRAIEITLQQEYVDGHRADLEALAAALTTPAS